MNEPRTSWFLGWATMMLVAGCAQGVEQRADDRLVELEASVDIWLDDSALWLVAARTSNVAAADVVDRLAAARFALLGVRMTREDVSDPVKAAAFVRAVRNLDDASPHSEQTPSAAELRSLEQDMTNATTAIQTSIDAYDVAARQYDQVIGRLPAGTLNRLDGTPLRLWVPLAPPVK